MVQHWGFSSGLTISEDVNLGGFHLVPYQVTDLVPMLISH
jgi:hypothetical protein